MPRLLSSAPCSAGRRAGAGSRGSARSAAAPRACPRAGRRAFRRGAAPGRAPLLVDAVEQRPRAGERARPPRRSGPACARPRRARPRTIPARARRAPRVASSSALLVDRASPVPVADELEHLAELEQDVDPLGLGHEQRREALVVVDRCRVRVRGLRGLAGRRRYSALPLLVVAVPVVVGEQVEVAARSRPGLPLEEAPDVPWRVARSAYGRLS